MKKSLALIFVFLTFMIFFASYITIAGAQVTQNPTDEATHVRVGIWLINVQKIDLAASTYRLDFYLWFVFNPSEVSANEIRQFEFINGQPSLRLIDETNSYLEYRVTGDFLKTFDFSDYPFETHALSIELEHSNLPVDSLVYEIDSSSYIEPTANVAGWDIGSLQSEVTQHSYNDDIYSRSVFVVAFSRPFISSLIKSLLPISLITAIGLLAFVMSAEDFAQRMALGITTLLSAILFHLSLVGGIPPTGYLTFADRIMISVYILFLFNIASAVYLMKLERANKIEKAKGFNKKALRFLPILIIVLVVMTIIF